MLFQIQFFPLYHNILAYTLIFYADDNPIFIGATFAGLLNMPCTEWRNKDIHYMIDTVICEMDSQENLSGIIMAGMSKYMEEEEFAKYVNSYLLTIGSVDVTRCTCTTYECNCPLDLYWEEGLSVLEPLYEYGNINKTDDTFFVMATEMVWDKVQMRMVAEELFIQKSCEEIDELFECLKPVPRTDTELDEMYASSEDSRSHGSSSLTTDSVGSSNSVDSDVEEGLVEYNLDEMEKGNLASDILVAAAFSLPEGLITDIDANNNEPDRHLGTAISMSQEATVAARKPIEQNDENGNRRHKSPKKQEEGEARVKPRSPGMSNMAKTKRWVASVSIAQLPSPTGQTSPHKKYSTEHRSPLKKRSAGTDEKAGADVKSPDVRPKPGQRDSPKPQRSPRQRRVSAKKEQQGEKTGKEDSRELPNRSADAAHKQNTKKKYVQSNSEPILVTQSSGPAKSPGNRRRRRSQQKQTDTKSKESTAGEGDKVPQAQGKVSKIQAKTDHDSEKHQQENEIKKKSPRRRRSGRNSGGKKPQQEVEKSEQAKKELKPPNEEHNYAKSPKDIDEKIEGKRSRNVQNISREEDAKPCKTWKGLCRNKGKVKCIQGMCANCCIQTDEDCKVHELTKKQKMTRNLIPACITGGIGMKSKRIDYNR